MKEWDHPITSWQSSGHGTDDGPRQGGQSVPPLEFFKSIWQLKTKGRLYFKLYREKWTILPTLLLRCNSWDPFYRKYRFGQEIEMHSGKVISYISGEDESWLHFALSVNKVFDVISERLIRDFFLAALLSCNIISQICSREASGWHIRVILGQKWGGLCLLTQLSETE